MNIPDDLKYTKEHEWIRLEGNIATIGVSDYAQSELGDIAWVELPGIGDETKQGDIFGTIEAVKTVEDLFAPVTGKVTEINEEIQDSPELVNDEPYGGGWMVKIECSNVSEFESLMSAEDYKGIIS